MADKGTIYISSNKKPKQPKKVQTQKNTRELDKLVEKSEAVVFELSSVFPFQLFPDKIIVDEEKVTIVRRHLFFKRIFPILIRDLLTVKVNRGILFSAMEFEIKRLEENPSPITFLWPDQADKASKYIMGLVGADRERLDLNEMPFKEVKKKIKIIGESEEDTRSVF